MEWLPKDSALRALDIEPVLGSRKTAGFVISGDCRGSESFWSASKQKKCSPAMILEARASSSSKPAFRYIFDELSTSSRSKIEAILAKNSKIDFLPGGAPALYNNTDPDDSAG